MSTADRPSRGTGPGPAPAGAKRWLDLGLIFLFAPLWLPLLILTALLVRITLGSPILFRQTRTGRQGRIFQLVKFRTMTNARSGTGDLLPDADRLTPFGRWLRARSLDELPEMFNILAGDMSLVGPRPLLPEYLPRYTPEQARRHEAPPGLTGWAQVHGRNAISWEERFKLDVWYVDHRSLRLDLKILALTLGLILRGEGVNAPGEATAREFQATTPQERPSEKPARGEQP